MSPVRVRLCIATGPSPMDSKTTIHLLRTIQLEESDDIYLLPVDKQPLRLHTELSTNSVVKSAIAALTTRGKSRCPVVTLKDEIKKLYMDEEGNFCFDGALLEEMSSPIRYDETANAAHVSKTLVSEKPLHSITKDIVLEKFSGRNYNATTWISLLETECARLSVPTNRYSEVLRLFIEGSATEWYIANRPTIPLASWSSWKAAFIETFSPRGWSDVIHAFAYRHVQGSMVEYATRKLSLIVDADPELSEKSKVNLIVVGLPPFAQQRIDRDDVGTVNKLIAKISQLDRFSFSSYRTKFSRDSPNNNNFRQGNSLKPGPTDSKTCTFCAKIGFPGRLHTEAECRTKRFYPHLNTNTNTKTYTNFQLPSTGIANNTNKDKNVRIANNVELENLVNNEITQKN